MPTPVGHSFIGLAISLVHILPRGSGLRMAWRIAREQWGMLLFCIFLANAPDVDYIPGVLSGRINAYHHFYTHTLGWIFLVGL